LKHYLDDTFEDPVKHLLRFVIVLYLHKIGTVYRWFGRLSRTKRHLHALSSLCRCQPVSVRLCQEPRAERHRRRAEFDWMTGMATCRHCIVSMRYLSWAGDQGGLQ